MADWVTELLKDYIGGIDYILDTNGNEKINCVLRRHVYADQNKERESIYRKVLECMAELADSCEPAIRLEKKQRTTQERQFFFRRMFTWVLVRVYEDFKDIEPYIKYQDTFSEMLDDALSKRNADEKKIRAKLKMAKWTIKEYLQIYNWVGPKEDEPSFYKLSEKEKADLIANHPKATRYSKVDTEYLNKQLIINEYNKGSEFVVYEPVFSEKLSAIARNHIYALFLCEVENAFFENIKAQGNSPKAVISSDPKDKNGKDFVDCLNTPGDLDKILRVLREIHEDVELDFLDEPVLSIEDVWIGGERKRWVLATAIRALLANNQLSETNRIVSTQALAKLVKTEITERAVDYRAKHSQALKDALIAAFNFAK